MELDITLRPYNGAQYTKILFTLNAAICVFIYVSHKINTIAFGLHGRARIPLRFDRCHLDANRLEMRRKFRNQALFFSFVIEIKFDRTLFINNF